MYQKLRGWLALKNYQYQAITGIFMLEPWERMIFSILLISFNFPFNLSGLICNVFDHASEMFILLNFEFVDATLVTILGMSVYTTYAYLPAYVHHMGSYLGVFEETQS
ncbi:hypothetical protein P5673_008298 [Acropora cervicornis]|uniref:Uncharacterized protein n=1 Tax=Acropora cervicornis TaxID=6130 RepID=A0AAD9QU72_ACRCE|nr:hypothetical protein P5673_008298 [Acropora cervicornis]